MSDDHPLARRTPLPEKIVRNNAWIDREHNTEKWPTVYEFIGSCIDEGETSLPRVVSKIKAWTSDSVSSGLKPMCRNGRIVDIPGESAGAIEDAMIYSRLRAICGNAIDAWIDLGSGWGWRLFDLWHLGHVAPVTQLFSIEYTPVGRECNERLLALDPSLPMTVHPFDFYQPDYGPIAPRRKRVAAFSVYSIYHVPNLAPDMFLQLLDLADEVDCVILEPIGFQLRADAPGHDRVGSSLAHAERNDFNRNLWTVLQDLEQMGRIVIDVAEPDLAVVIARMP